MNDLDKISDIKHVFYINLEKRSDRKEKVEKELSNIGISAQRFNAIQLTQGAVGCSLSHLKCLQRAKENNWSHVMICEDDIQFLDPQLFINQLNRFLHNHKKWDVILLAGNNLPPYKKVDETCIKVNHCQTTTGYIVQSHYFDNIINNIREGIEKLIREPDKPFFYAIDKYWISLQKEGDWYLIIPLSVTQRVDYSDIEKRMTNYKKMMIDLDKKYLMK